MSDALRQNLVEDRREWMRREAAGLGRYYDMYFAEGQESQRRERIALRVSANPIDRAEARAIAALKDWLTPDQCQQYEKNGHFDVIGCDSKQRYRIYSAPTFNIICEDNEVYCLTLSGNLPLGDNMLMQAIGLELDETAALAVANRRSVAWSPDGWSATERWDADEVQMGTYRATLTALTELTRRARDTALAEALLHGDRRFDPEA